MSLGSVGVKPGGLNSEIVRNPLYRLAKPLKYDSIDHSDLVEHSMPNKGHNNP